MIIICGETIAEVERDLEAAKMAIATGAPMGVGGATIEDVEKALCGLRSAMGESNPPISNPNYIAPKPCCCGCNCEDEEDEDECPSCGAVYPDWDDECCNDCGYGCEDEDDTPPTDAVEALIDWLEANDAPIGLLRWVEEHMYKIFTPRTKHPWGLFTRLVGVRQQAGI